MASGSSWNRRAASPPLMFLATHAKARPLANLARSVEADSPVISDTCRARRSGVSDQSRIQRHGDGVQAHGQITTGSVCHSPPASNGVSRTFVLVVRARRELIVPQHLNVDELPDDGEAGQHPHRAERAQPPSVPR